MIEFIQNNYAEILLKTSQQVILVGVSTFFAFCIGVPLGIWAANARRVRVVTTGVAGIVQTIPSLALLAFLLPVFGIGTLPAIIALSLYSLLPIIRNTLLGFQTLPSEALEAAHAIGLTAWQRLRWVEFPLAFPTIITGLRTAVVINVGVATLASFIGAGGLGDFINRGLALNSVSLILMGAVPAAMLALSLDALLKRIEKMVRENRRIHRRRLLNLPFIVLMSTLSLLFIIGFIDDEPAQSRPGTVRIATKNFTEQFILGEILSQLIEAKTNLKTEQINLGTTENCHRALALGDVDMYPEYTGTAYLVVLGRDLFYHEHKIHSFLRRTYQEKFGVEWLPSFGFENAQSLAITKDFSKKYNIHTLSDLVPYASKLTVGVPAEFMQRPDALPGLVKAYGFKFKKIKEMDPGLMYEALVHGDVDIALAFNTDGRLHEYHLVMLQDNEHMFPSYHAAPLIREEVVKAHPELKVVLKLLANKIDNQTMQNLNYEVDLGKRLPSEVAREFLEKTGLLALDATSEIHE